MRSSELAAKAYGFQAGSIHLKEAITWEMTQASLHDLPINEVVKMEKRLDSWNMLHAFSRALNKEVNALEYLYKRPASEGDTPVENLILMVSKLIHMSKMLSVYVTSGNTATIGDCLRLAEEIHLHEKLATAALYEEAQDMGKDVFKVVVRFPSRIERISISFRNILNSWQIKTMEGIPVSDEAQEELAYIFEVVIDMVESLRDFLTISDKFMLEHIKSQSQKLTEIVKDARSANWDRLETGICRPQRASVFAEVIDSFENVNEYLSRMYDSLLYLGACRVTGLILSG